MSTPRRKLEFVAGFALLFAALWVAWDTALVYPLKIFVVLLHEISHALAAVATGGRIEKIVLDPGQGGACHCPGGNAFLTLSAGYLGSLLWGAAMVEAAQSARIRTDWVNGAVGAAVIALTLLYVRSPFGVAFGLAFGATLLLSARRAGEGVNRAILLVIGLVSVLYAILDIKSDVLDRPGLRSDAAMLAELTHVPTLVWGVLWIAAALWVAWLLWRRAYREA